MDAGRLVTRWLSVREVATRLGIDTSLVSRYCQEGRLRARKPGRDWLIEPTSVDVFETERRRPGRPPTREVSHSRTPALSGSLVRCGFGFRMLAVELPSEILGGLAGRPRNGPPGA